MKKWKLMQLQNSTSLHSGYLPIPFSPLYPIAGQITSTKCKMGQSFLFVFGGRTGIDTVSKFVRLSDTSRKTGFVEIHFWH